MTLQEKQEFENIKIELAKLQDLFYKGDFPDKKEFYKLVVLRGGVSFTQTLMGFFGVTPVVRQEAVTNPTGGAVIDSESRTAIGQIKTALTNLGLTL